MYYHQALKFMYVLHVSLHVMLVLKHSRANVTLEGLDVTNTMDSGQVSVQVAFLCKLPAANLALVSGARALRSAVSMRRIVVSVDRRLVVERHVADLTLDATRRPNLLTQSKTI